MPSISASINPSICLFPVFASAVTGYIKAGKNPHDDAPDALTGMVEQRDAGGYISDAELMEDFL